MKSLLPLIGVLLFPVLSVPVAAVPPAGETLTTTVVCLDPAGSSINDGTGITYSYGGTTSFEPKVYPAAYWGTFPLYMPGTTVTFRVTLTNSAQGKKPYNVKVQAISNVLKEAVDGGGLGQEIGLSQTWEVTDLLPGESWTADGSVYYPNDGSIPSGLDITRILVSHLNNGGGGDDENPAGLIDVDYCVWCPPPVRVAAASQNTSAFRLARQWRSERSTQAAMGLVNTRAAQQALDAAFKRRRSSAAVAAATS